MRKTTAVRSGAMVLGLGLTAAALSPTGAAAAGVPAGTVTPTAPSMGAAAESPDGPTSPEVTTDTGPVRGIGVDEVESFRGIPYAAPPVGDRRWERPQAVEPWSTTRAAEEFGATCAVLPSTNGPRSEAEDCLFVNVQRPAGAEAGDDLPVFVFIHGGGLVNGSSNQADMDKIVRETGVVGVTMNYRLNVFGFLGADALAGEDGAVGNSGFLDQQAALRWVQRNIAAFGGDPEAVTIGGESAGGWSVCGHLTSPGSQGLFSQAIIQSGACHSQTPAQADEGATAFATAAGCTDAEALEECLRGLSTAELLDASEGFSALLVHDTPALPVAPRSAVEAGEFTRVPLINGATRDEGRTFTQGLVGQGQEAYEEFVRSTFGGRADLVLAEYPWPETSDDFTAAYLAGAVLTDSGVIGGSIGGCGTKELTDAFTRWTPTWAYEFANRTGPGLVEDYPGYEWGAGHAAELAYLFPSFNNGTPITPLFDEGDQQLADEMVQRWGAFVKTGRPQVEDERRWPRYTHRWGATMSLREAGESRLIWHDQYDAQHNCDFWRWLEEDAPLS